MVGFASCGKDANVGDKTTQTGAMINITMKATSPGAPQSDTRATVDGTAMNWEAGDAFTLFDNAGNNATMTLSAGAGTATGTFTGAIASAPARTAFYAINAQGAVGSDPAAVPVAVTADQVQAGATDAAGLGHYMISVGQVTGDPVAADNLTVQFQHLTAIWDIMMDNPSGLSIKSVKVSASDSFSDTPFVTAGTVDITGAAPVFTPATYSNYIATTFSAAQTGSSVTARLAMLPVTLTGKNLQITVTLDNGQTYLFNRPGVTKDITGGKNVQSSVSLTADYTQLRINEVNGVGKWFEIYNMGTADINLAGVQVYYSNKEPAVYNLTWTGTSTQIVPAGGFFSTMGTTLLTGLSANNANVRLQMMAPNGDVLDTYEELLDINTGYDAIYNKDHARIPDGTGLWYYLDNSTGTPGASNGTSTVGYTQFGNEGAPYVPPVTADYTQLVLNEIDGNAKAIELYNKGTVALSLTGVTLWKNIDTPPSGSAWWTGTAASGSIAPGAYVVIYQTGQNTGGDVPGFVGANGISPKQTLKFDLLDPSNQNLGEFVRGVSPWQTGISDVTPNSYQRIPNGTGSWQQAPPTIGAANAASGTAIPAN